MRQGKFAKPMGPSRPGDSSSLQRHDTRANQFGRRDISEKNRIILSLGLCCVPLGGPVVFG